MGIAAAETIIAWQSHEGPRIARAGGHDIIQCTMCGFRHVVPLPEPRAFEHTYRDVYVREQPPGAPSPLSDDKNWSEIAHADLLESFGVDYFQGYHFGEPIIDPDWAKA